MKLSGASIIISTNGRKSKLRSTLHAISEQQTINIPLEVIIISSNKSSSKNLSFLPKSSNKIQVNQYQRSNSSHTEAKNFGIIKSKYDLLILLDDDTVPVGKFWLQEIIKPFYRLNAKACCGRILLPNKLPVDLGVFTSLFTVIDEGDRGNFLPLGHTPPHAHFAILKQTIKSIGGYRRELGRRGSLLLSGEDDEVSLSLATLSIPIYYQPTAIVVHRFDVSRISNIFVINRVFWQGITDVITGYILKKKKSFIDFPNLKKILLLFKLIINSKDINHLYLFLLTNIYYLGRIIAYIFLPYYFFVSKPRPIDIYKNL